MGQQSSIHHAANKDSTKPLRKVLRKKAGSINQKIDQKTALFNAVKENNKETVDLLLEHQADPNVVCAIQRSDGYSFEWTAIHEACRQNNQQMLSSLLQYGGDADLPGHHQMTPLHVAAWHGHRESVQMLIDAGCDVNKLDRFQESALVVPICNGDYEVVETLLYAGCKLNTRAWGNLSIRSSCWVESFFHKEGPFSLLSLAVMYGHFDLATLLLQHGYKPNKYEMYVFLKIIKNSSGDIDDKEKQLIQCYVAAGHRQKSVDEKSMLDNLLSPPNIGFTQDTIDWVKLQITCPSLKDLCRMTIRNAVRENGDEVSVYRGLGKIPLPSALLTYLRLDEYKKERVDTPTFAVPQQCVCCLERFRNTSEEQP